MTSLLFLILIGLAFCAVFVYALTSTNRTQKLLSKFTAKSRFPIAIERVMVLAQIIEIVHIVESTTVLNILVMLMLFGVWLALKSGTEGEMY